MTDIGGILSSGLGRGITSSRPAKKAPQSAYTRDVIERGAAAVADRRKAGTFDSTQPTDALSWMQATGYGQGGNDAYNQWFASQGFNPTYKVTFGQSKKGKYAGFATEGELKAAISGRAEQLRQEQNALAQRDYETAQSGLDTLDSQYAANDAIAQHQMAAPTKAVLDLVGYDLHHLARSAAPGGDGQMDGGFGSFGGSGGAPVADGGHVPGARVPYIDDATHHQQLIDAANAGNDTLHRMGDYDQQLREWYGQQTEPLMQQSEAAQQQQLTPLAMYATKAGADYGVDPTLISGWYPASSQVTDFNTQRNLQSIQDYGMPYSDYQSYLASQAADQRRNQSVQDQADAQAAKDAQTAQDQQLEDGVYQATGMDVGSLASAADLTKEQVYSIVTDPNYQQAASDLYSVLTDPNFTTLSADDQAQSVDDVIGQFRTDPTVYRLIQAQFGAYLS